MDIVCYEVDVVPDLSLHKYQFLSSTGVDGVLGRHKDFLRQWHGICRECHLTMHLLYYFDPTRKLGKRIKIMLLFQGEKQSLNMTQSLLEYSPLSDYYTFKKCQIIEKNFAACATLMKKERVADIYNPLNEKMFSVHYVPKIEMDEKARMYDLFRMLEMIGKSENSNGCAYRIDLYPSSLENDTRNKIKPIIKKLKGDNEIRLVKTDEENTKDNYTNEISKEYEQWLTSIETTPHFRVNIYAFASDNLRARILLNAAASEAVASGDISLANIKPAFDGKLSFFSRMGNEPESYCRYKQEAVLQEWSTTFTLEEVEPFFRLPALYDAETIEIPKETAPIVIDDGITIGKDDNNYPVLFPLEDLSRHAFFTGAPGSGKTNSMLHFLTEIHKKGIPFLVFEPAKKEYRDILLNEEMKDVDIFSPHLQSYFPLRVNPFSFPKGVRLNDHINALLEVFKGTFSLEGPTYRFLSRAICNAYESLGWDIESINRCEASLEFPTLQTVYDNLEKEINASDYDGELKGNMKSFLQVRLGGLMERDSGELYNTSVSTINAEDWINRSAIVELEMLDEQAKNFFVLLVCHYILETIRIDPKGGRDKKGDLLPVRHVLFIEEAHNIIAPNTQQESSDTVDPKISATAYIVKMLAEVRALRECIVIADQLPTAIAPEVTKNTGLKLVHRLTASDDRELIGQAISASAFQLEQMASFSKGKALIFHEKTQKPFSIQVSKWEKSPTEVEISDDEVLYSKLCDRPQIQKAIRCAIDSWKERCFYPFSNYRVIRFLENYPIYVEENVVKKEKKLLLQECDSLCRKAKMMKRIWEKGTIDKKLLGDLQDIITYCNDIEKEINTNYNIEG